MNEETKDNALENKLKNIGYEKSEFEPVVLNRFIVKVEGIPSHLICSVKMPIRSVASSEWSQLELELYNPVDFGLEKRLLEMNNGKSGVDVQVCYLSPTGEVVTDWNIQTNLVSIDFGKFAWKNEGDPHIITLYFDVNSVTID